MEGQEPLSILIIDQDAASRNYLSVMLRKAGYTVLTAPSAREGLISIWRDLPALAIFDPALSDLPAVDMVQRLRQDRRTTRMPLIALSGQENADEMNALLSAGCNEYLVKSGQAVAQLTQIIPRLLHQQTDVKKGGHLVVFMSAKGGTGTSSLCANVAMCLGKNKPEASVVVADMVLPIGSIASIVGYTDRLNLISVAMQNPDQITGRYLREHLPKINEWYFRLLAGSPDPDVANQLPGDRLGPVVAALQEAFDFVFIDLGRSLSRLSLPIILHADVLALVLSTEAASVTLTQTVWSYLQTQGVDSRRVYAILNRAVGLEGLTKTEAEKMLGLTIQYAMPYMGGNFSLANNRHEPIATKFPLDAATLTLNQMADQIADLAQRLRRGG
ncbi:MAG: response regulator [Anaerolineales bacterium]